MAVKRQTAQATVRFAWGRNQFGATTLIKKKRKRIDDIFWSEGKRTGAAALVAQVGVSAVVPLADMASMLMAVVGREDARHKLWCPIEAR